MSESTQPEQDLTPNPGSYDDGAELKSAYEVPLESLNPINPRLWSEHKWQELEEVNVDEVVESIMLHWRKSVCKRLSIIRR